MLTCMLFLIVFVQMNNENDIEDDDTEFRNELHQFVATLAKCTPAQLKRYDEQMTFMESIHDEIRRVHSHFMPAYVPPPENDGLNFGGSGKYLDVTYNVVI